MLGTAKFALVLQIRRHADELGKASRSFTYYAYANMIVLRTAANADKSVAESMDCWSEG